MEIIKIMNAVLAPCQTDPENLRKNPRLLHIISCLSLEVKEEKI